MAKRKGRPGSDRAIAQDAVKALVANIRFASVDDPVKTITLTSSVPNEGKTSIAVLLARTLASAGKDVLLVECDTRHRSLATALGAHSRGGLYGVLAEQVDLRDAVVSTPTRGVSFLDCEPRLPNPDGILSSRRFQLLAQRLRQAYDYVVFDTPPLVTFVDGAIVGSVTDATLLVARQDYVRRDDLVASYAQLQKAGANVIGVVMNYCENEMSDYYNYYARGERAERHEGAEAPEEAPVSVPRSESVRVPRVVPVPDPSSTSPSAPVAHPAGRVSPGSTAQFLAGTNYVARGVSDEE